MKPNPQQFVEIHFADWEPWRRTLITSAVADNGEDTGKKDCDGARICVGDIIQDIHNEYYEKTIELVCWSQEYAAYISWYVFHEEGKCVSRGGSESLNGERFSKCKKIGNIVDNPALFRSIKKIK